MCKVSHRRWGWSGKKADVCQRAWRCRMDDDTLSYFFFLFFFLFSFFFASDKRANLQPSSRSIYLKHDMGRGSFTVPISLSPLLPNLLLPNPLLSITPTSPVDATIPLIDVLSDLVPARPIHHPPQLDPQHPLAFNTNSNPNRPTFDAALAARYR